MMLTNTASHAKMGIILGFIILIAFTIFGMPGLYVAGGFALGAILAIEGYQVYLYVSRRSIPIRTSIAIYIEQKGIDTLVDVVVGIVCAAIPIVIYI